MRDSFVFYKSYYEAIELLPKNQRADAYRAIFELMFNDNDITDELPNTAKAIFLMAKPTLEANNKRYENGKKGGRPKKANENQEENETETKTEPNQKPNENLSHNQTKTETKPNVNVNVNDNVNVNVNDNKEIDKVSVHFFFSDNQCVGKNSTCKRKSAMTINGKYYCSQHGRIELSKLGKMDLYKEADMPLLDKCLQDEKVQAGLEIIGKDEAFLKELLAYRRKIKKPFKTELGVRGVLKNLHDTSIATGKSIDELFAYMQEREWQTIQADYLRSSSPQKTSSKQDNFKQEAMEAISSFASRAKGVEHVG